MRGFCVSMSVGRERTNHFQKKLYQWCIGRIWRHFFKFKKSVATSTAHHGSPTPKSDFPTLEMTAHVFNRHVIVAARSPVNEWSCCSRLDVFVHCSLREGLERDAQVAREELTQKHFFQPWAQIVLKLVASWPDKWCHIIMLVTYKSGSNRFYVSFELC